ncbi:YtxH domain-containing protein [Sporosarcina aquimarina]|uniref:YtxH domain-containing protein n=1 Tax=Sporosarcina aquimarina TaxID=114975 RepID=A0ABU4G1R5_9BACL|nr:YtxH domain-containing protein [Sporosarcina aquimarina]MDW0110327.1 YtxH domain-containing protein [Sporosarcina aquimarina]
MSENYNKSKTNQDINFNGTYENSYGEPSQLPMNYNYFPTDTDRFYEDDSSGSGSFLMGALVGGVIGAAAALFLAPKTGKEMREDLSTQAVQIKNKSIELSSTAKDKAVDFTATAKDKAADLSSTAKDKAAEFSAVAKEKTDDLKKNVQEQTENVTGKVKTMTSKSSAPLDDGTASSEGEEPIVKKDDKNASKKESANKTSGKKEASYQTTENSDVAYDNSENIGDNKIVNQNAVSDIEPKKN